MPRQPRYFLPHLPQHVIQRGVDKQPVFFHAEDYALYMRALQDAVKVYPCQVHAYVLMTNHVHLLVTPLELRALPRLIQAMGRDYVQVLNRRYERTGTLWEGRYKASLVQDDRHLLTCYRYIELNPVRAGMVPTPGAYPYSSFRFNALGEPDELITPHPVYEGLSKDPSARVEAYLALFEETLDSKLLERIRSDTNACRVIGNERFKDDIERMLQRSVRPGKSGRPRKPRT